MQKQIGLGKIVRIGAVCGFALTLPLLASAEKICPKCKRHYPDAAFTCNKDGASLVKYVPPRTTPHVRKPPVKPPKKNRTGPSGPKRQPHLPPRTLEPLRVNATDGAEMTLIPAGAFAMGSSPAEFSALEREYGKTAAREDYGNELPQHTVSVSAYYIYRYPVTVKQYKQFCRQSGREMPPSPPFNVNWEKEDHPMVRVTWDEARAYCQWAGGNLCDLPTEAQWERAARGGQSGTYFWGDAFDPGRVWKSNARPGDAGGTVRVGRFPANRFGLYDMAGNVWHWCRDGYSDSFYSTPAAKQADPVNNGPSANRVLRGGSWYEVTPGAFRCATRAFGGANAWGYNFGFRCVMRAVPR